MGGKSRARLGAALALCAAALALAPARAEVVVVTAAKASTGALSKEQVTDVFMGKNTSLTPVDQADSSAAREEFYGKLLGKSASQMKSYWAKLAFTGKGTPPREAAGSGEVKKLLAADPTLVGYVEKSAVDNSLKVLFPAP